MYEALKVSTLVIPLPITPVASPPQWPPFCMGTLISVGGSLGYIRYGMGTLVSEAPQTARYHRSAVFFGGIACCSHAETLCLCHEHCSDETPSSAAFQSWTTRPWHSPRKAPHFVHRALLGLRFLPSPIGANHQGESIITNPKIDNATGIKNIQKQQIDLCCQQIRFLLQYLMASNGQEKELLSRFQPWKVADSNDPLANLQNPTPLRVGAERQESLVKVSPKGYYCYLAAC